MSLFSSSRCVLILGDSGLQIYNVTRMAAKFIDHVPWETDEFEKSVRNLIVKRCKRKPVVILNDMVEQHYRKERIPKVSFFDRSNVLKRRLSVAFPNYRVRAALKLKDKNSSKAIDGQGGSYLFAAVPSSEMFNKTMASIRLSGAPIVGLYLLPVEGAEMVRTLSAKLSRGKRYKAVWTIFIGQHYNGGLRQIVTRNGELALTRMTPIVDTDVEPELWAKELSSELNATMSYLSRFGYTQDDGLDVIVIANNALEHSLEEAIDVECNLKVLTSAAAASLVGSRLGRQEDLRYADSLHAAYLGKKSKFVLPMQSAIIESLTKPRRVASLILIGLLAGCAYFGFMSVKGWNRMADVSDRLKVSVQQNRSLDLEYKHELEKKKQLGFDFLLVNNSIEVFNELEEKKLKPLSVFRGIGLALGTDLRLDKLVLKMEEEKIHIPANPEKYTPKRDEVKFLLDAVMTISFPHTVSPDVGVQKINVLQDRLRKTLPDYEVSVIKQVADLSYTGNFVGESGTELAEGAMPEDYTAEIQVRGEIK